ncbi:putative nucleotidyltransferase [Bradyrhizobium sp. USDA 4524]|uniref:nucleotidyltransferase domain-containing protein n=1 Tax=unclassified Bradyrhizobium TaxID=2631580 RepID=UPI00209E4E0C|nr:MULTISPECIES: nucleotidyltransferase domain-containing protein [unclassified Bradyrhizobium]MCP1845980.1 putative nucleotidyltransferase [Bradyrhizobium sp. USDA 4538]MCP1907386.1 putative nucleotidyltransferase [Bradyrhizobium sp. USDA 4537]MCP1985172.1 putative nucleotidyltransferase [Bradyrhizobium sp. USDA 4539]
MKDTARTESFINELRHSDNLLELFQKKGFSLEKFSRQLTGSIDDVGILLVGSVAEGYATTSSDIDLLVLSYVSRDEVDLSDNLRIESGKSLETLVYLDGVEINVEVVLREDYDHVAKSLDKIAADAALGRGMTKMPMIDNYSLRFLHRLRTGIVVEGEAVIDEFRNDFRVQSLPLYLAIKRIILARESLEDAKSSDPAVYGLVEFICRDIIEHACLALAAARGFTSQSRRFVLNWINQRSGEEQQLALLHALRRQLVETRALEPAAKSELVRRTEGLYVEVLKVLQEDYTMRRILDQTFANISYAE